MKYTFAFIAILVSLFLSGCKDDVSSIRMINRAELILKTNPDSAHLLADSISLPDKLSDKELARWCMLSSRIADTLFTDLPYSNQLERAQKYYLSYGTPAEQAQITLYLGRAYVDDSDYNKAMHTYLVALDIALKAKEHNQAGYICSYMGDLYHFEENHLLGRDKYAEAARYFKQADNRRSYAYALRDAGRMYAFADSNEVALDYLKKAYSVVSGLNDSLAMSSITNGLGNTYAELSDFKQAKEYLLLSIRLDSSDRAPSYSALAGIYTKERRFDSARVYLQQANISTWNEYTPASVMYEHYTIAKEEGAYYQALQYLEKYTSVSDSVREVHRNTNIVDAEKRYNQLNMLLDNAELKTQNQNVFILSLISGTACLLLYVIYQIHIRRKNKKIYLQQIDIERTNNLLLRKQAELRIKQTELQDLKRKLSEKESAHLDLKLRLEKEYNLKMQEIDELACKTVRQQNELLMASVIGKKLARLAKAVVAGAKESPLSEKDWKALTALVNEIYPNLERKLLDANMKDSEINYCYISLFRQDVNGEAILLGINTDSVNKRIQRVRQKLGIIGKNYDLPTYLIDICK